ASEPASLSDRQIRVYLGPSEARELTPVDAPARIDQLAAGARQVASQLDHGTLIPLRKAVEPGVTPMAVGDTRVLPTMNLATTENGRGFKPQSQLYVATPAVLRYLEIDPASVKPSTDFILDRSVKANDLVIPSMTSRKGLAVTNV